MVLGGKEKKQKMDEISGQVDLDNLPGDWHTQTSFKGNPL